MRKAVMLLLVVGGVLFPAVALAQSMTGTLIGTVKDEQGAMVAGASVRVCSPDLLGGPVEVTTNEKGQLRFPSLNPGWYELRVTKPGFQPIHDLGILIAAGSTIERTMILRVAGREESVVVQGPGSRVEARSSGIEKRIGYDELRTIPTRRFSMIDWLRFAPGFSPTSPTSGAINGVSANGSGTNEHIILIDGTNFTCPCSGEIRAELGVDFLREIQIMSVGASAEFGNMQGAVINVITRQGSDRFLYDASYYSQLAHLTSQPVRLEFPGSGGQTSGYHRDRYLDATGNAGGPVSRERLWFFAGYQYLRDYDSQPGADPRFPRTYEQNKLFVKLTWKLAPGWQLMQSYHQERWVNPEPPTSVKPFEATLRRHASVPAITFGHLTNTRSANTVWDVRFGHFVSARTDDPSSGDVTRASHFDDTTKLWSGAPPTIGGVTLMRTTAKGTIDHYRPDLLGANHQWRFGAQLERGEHRAPTIIPTGTRFIDKSGLPFKTISSNPSILGGVFVTASAFVSDSLTVGNTLTINAGIRFDHNRAISQDLRALDLAGNETGAVIAGAGTLYTWNLWSPRLGVTLKLSDDGRTMLRSSFGRFSAGVLTGELGPFHPAAAKETTTEFDAATGVTKTTIVDPRENLELDPAIRAPHTDEFSIGVDREVGRGLAVAIAYVRKDGRQFIGWTDACDCYREEVKLLQDGRTLPVFALDKSSDDRLFRLTNPPGYSLTYNGLVLAAEKRRANGWYASGSYTYSRASGLQASSGATAAGSQVSTVAGVPILTFGRDPNDLTHARGLLPNDRPHMLRVMGSLDVPGTRWAVAASAQHFTGKPWSSSAQVKLPQGEMRILLEPRGARRLSSQTLVDLRVSRSFSLGSAARVELLIDVLNALNETAEEGLATDDEFSPKFAQPTLFVDPRRVMLGVRLNLGR